MKSVLAIMRQCIDREVQLLGEGKLLVYPGGTLPFPRVVWEIGGL